MDDRTTTGFVRSRPLNRPSPNNKPLNGKPARPKKLRGLAFILLYHPSHAVGLADVQKWRAAASVISVAKSLSNLARLSSSDKSSAK
jgi:hypothetical protein